MTSEDRETEIRRRLAMPYHRLISGEPVEGYLGEVLELPGCLTRATRHKKRSLTLTMRWRAGLSRV